MHGRESVGQLLADQFNELVCSADVRVCLANVSVWWILPSIPLALVILEWVLKHDLDQAGPTLRHGIGKGLIECGHGLDFNSLHAHPAGDIGPLQIRITEIQ